MDYILPYDPPVQLNQSGVVRLVYIGLKYIPQDMQNWFIWNKHFTFFHPSVSLNGGVNPELWKLLHTVTI